ncbi:mediator complex, subunit Med11 [Emericellopsis atlantica]|uniref:Mediator of RNA polymerase II transcription subunit 11 n=1 Tax=Emericellopsis atlantica TaxID=2614577 RepID=A0A9P8CNG3_9HYPO|nr:mediator complex, subunit Med11 [Emericellopsis atlantica]KAG9253107.1 mediator complex, subunit Med11 [Emericellopsis atlantica]
MGDEPVDIHKPFTVEENIRQLNAIDQSIVQLMNHTANALNAVSMPHAASEVDVASQKQGLQDATDAFLDALNSVEVRMKRQIMALEEAGIVNLKPAAKGTKVSLKPDGMGNVGKLDIGWLNSRGNKVEREMEAELWSKAKDYLEKESETLKKA